MCKAFCDWTSAPLKRIYHHTFDIYIYVIPETFRVGIIPFTLIRSILYFVDGLSVHIKQFSIIKLLLTKFTFKHGFRHNLHNLIYNERLTIKYYESYWRILLCGPSQIFTT